MAKALKNFARTFSGSSGSAKKQSELEVIKQFGTSLAQIKLSNENRDPISIVLKDCFEKLTSTAGVQTQNLFLISASQADVINAKKFYDNGCKNVYLKVLAENDYHLAAKLLRDYIKELPETIEHYVTTEQCKDILKEGDFNTTFFKIRQLYEKDNDYMLVLHFVFHRILKSMVNNPQCTEKMKDNMVTYITHSSWFSEECPPEPSIITLVRFLLEHDSVLSGEQFGVDLFEIQIRHKNQSCIAPVLRECRDAILDCLENKDMFTEKSENTNIAKIRYNMGEKDVLINLEPSDKKRRSTLAANLLILYLEELPLVYKAVDDQVNEYVSFVYAREISTQDHLLKALNYDIRFRQVLAFVLEIVRKVESKHPKTLPYLTEKLAVILFLGGKTRYHKSKVIKFVDTLLNEFDNLFQGIDIS